MVAYRNFKKRAYKKKTGYKKRSYPKKKQPFNFEKRVKTVISKMAENKMAVVRKDVGLKAYNSTTWNTTIACMTPFTSFLTIPQGITQDTRVGNKITVKRLVLKGVLIPYAYSALNNLAPKPLIVKLFFLTRKDSPMEIYSPLDGLFQFGSSSESPSSSLQDINKSINTDLWRIHTSRTYKLGYASYDGTGTNAAAQGFANNDYKFNHFVNIDLTKYCNKTIVFDDNNINPNTRNIVMYPMVYTADGSALAVDAIPCNFKYNIEMEFEDM